MDCLNMLYSSSGKGRSRSGLFEYAVEERS